MTDWIVIATGQSMNQEIADYIAPYWAGNRCKVIVVSDAYRLAPWADALVSSDGKWWMANPEALEFIGPKYARNERRDVIEYRPTGKAVNSGLMAMHLAKDKGASRIILLGFDMHGTHFFGKHDKKWGNNPHEVLTNTTERRFQDHIAEFSRWRGCEVVNCTPGSALKFFPMADIKDIIK